MYLVLHCRLHYTMATLSELARYADIAPSGIPHKVLCDVKFQGYDLPAGTSVLTNLNACHRDPEFWSHPDEFYPEHFLDAQGQYISQKEGFVPYGTGILKKNLYPQYIRIEFPKKKHQGQLFNYFNFFRFKIPYFLAFL